MIQRKFIQGTTASSEEPNKTWTCFRHLWQCCGHPMWQGGIMQTKERFGSAQILFLSPVTPPSCWVEWSSWLGLSGINLHTFLWQRQPVRLDNLLRGVNSCPNSEDVITSKLATKSQRSENNFVMSWFHYINTSTLLSLRGKFVFRIKHHPETWAHKSILGPSRYLTDQPS